MDIGDYIAIATIALPLIAKACSDWQANAVANHNAQLARIVGMAGRQAATVARTLTELRPGVDAKAVEKTLVANSVRLIMTEMESSVAKVGGTPDVVTGIVQSELDKVVVPATASASAVVKAGMEKLAAVVPIQA